MVDLTGKGCAFPFCENPATIPVLARGRHKETGELAEIEFGVCEEHLGATCGVEGCGLFPKTALKWDNGYETPICDGCADQFERSATISFSDGTMVIQHEGGERFRALALPTTPLQG
jgi:hypothetical protein